MDLLYGLFEVIHIVVGCIKDYIVELPPTNKILSGVSIGIIVVLQILMPLHFAKPSRISMKVVNRNWSKLLIIPLLAIITACSVAAYRIYPIERVAIENIDDIVKKTDTIVTVAKTKFDGISIDWTDIDKIWDKLKSSIDTSLSEFLQEKVVDKLGNQDDAIESLSSQIAIFDQFFVGLKEDLDRCSNETGIDGANLKMLAEQVIQERLNASKHFEYLEDHVSIVRDNVAKIIDEQRKKDFNQGSMERRMRTMSEMLENFHQGIRSTYKTRHYYIQRTDSEMPFFAIGRTCRISLHITSIFMIIYSLCSIFALLFKNGENAASWLNNSCDMSAVTTVMFTLSILFVATKYWCGYECPLGKNFGLHTFVPKYNHENRRMDLCKKAEQSFFEELNNEPIIQIDHVEKVLEIQKKKDIMLVMNENLSRATYQLTNDVFKNLEAMEMLSLQLNKWANQSNTSCIALAQKENSVKTSEILNIWINDNKEYFEIWTHMNSRWVDHSYDTVRWKIIHSYLHFVVSLEENIKEKVSNLSISDFNCQDIYENYLKIHQNICHPIDIELDNYFLVLISMLMTCLVATIINIITIRAYDLYFVGMTENCEETGEDE